MGASNRRIANSDHIGEAFEAPHAPASNEKGRACLARFCARGWDHWTPGGLGAGLGAGAAGSEAGAGTPDFRLYASTIALPMSVEGTE